MVIENDKPVVTLNDVVAGTMDKSKNDATPKGVWYVLVIKEFGSSVV